MPRSILYHQTERSLFSTNFTGKILISTELVLPTTDLPVCLIFRTFTFSIVNNIPNTNTSLKSDSKSNSSRIRCLRTWRRWRSTSTRKKITVRPFTTADSPSSTTKITSFWVKIPIGAKWSWSSNLTNRSAIKYLALPDMIYPYFFLWLPT